VEPVKIPIADSLDLHTFLPREIPDLLEDYFWIQKRRVQGLLQKNPLVISFKDAPPEAGGWGATLVELKMIQGES